MAGSWSERGAADASEGVAREKAMRELENKRQKDIELVGCASVSPNSGANWQTVKPAAYPSLPRQAQQEPLPSFCVPTCSANLSEVMKSWQRTLTEQGQAHVQFKSWSQWWKHCKIRLSH